MRVTFRVDESRLVEKGSGSTDRTLVVAIVQMLWPMGPGLKPVMTQASAWKAAFAGSTRGGLSWLTPSAIPVGRDGDRFQVNLRLPFEVELITT